MIYLMNKQSSFLDRLFPEKRCTKCQESKPLDQFYRNKIGKDGYTSQCKACERIRTEEWRKANPEKRQKALDKWRAENPDKLKAQTKRWSAQHPGKNSCRLKKWRRDHPEKRRVYDQRRRAQKKSLPSTFTNEEWAAAMGYFDYRCAYCGKDARELAQDHFIPVAKNGGYTRDNIIPSCTHCNSSKGKKEFFVWASRKFGEDNCNQIYQRIQEYFLCVKEGNHE